MTPDWIAVDWGTSNLRAWAMDAAGRARAEAASDAGMGGLAPSGFEPALLALIGPWLAPGRVTDVVACGMVGARQGWTEAPYAAVPAPSPAPRSATRASPSTSCPACARTRRPT
jgi:2-dehydro-3-deoxygalactonokinase